MKLSQSYFYTLRENAKDEDSISGNLLVRSGMIKKSSAGVYMILPMGKRVLKKIEDIVREEMDATDAQELLMPAMILEEVYEKSGRREAFGSNMFSFQDRYQKQYVLGPTHEELFAIAATMNGKSYKDFPYNLYQIQTKYRDETRPRYGLIRVREFIMKDAYSFDKDLEGLDVSYKKMFDAYCKIFDRLHLNYRIVKADTGAMGGMLSEEFQAISDIGEDIVVSCSHCDFASNIEICEVIQKQDMDSEEFALEEVYTPNAKTIAEVSKYLGKKEQDFVKTLLYKVNHEIIAFLLPGDRELNETKVCKLFQANEIELANFEEVETITGAKVGFAGPIGLQVKIVMDRQVMRMKNFVVGANRTDYHYINVNKKDFKYDIVEDICNVKEMDACPHCGNQLKFDKGIEVGNTFKLGTKYADALQLRFLDENNELKPVVMGSYGIGLERCMAAIVEQHNDEYGMIWPKEVAPFEVAIIVANMKDEIQVQYANELYNSLKEHQIDVLFDDRKERAGVKFKDMDLIGIPIQIVVGKGLERNIVEVKHRSTMEKEEITLDNIVQYIINC